MSLWTPSGEHRVPDDQPAAPGDPMHGVGAANPTEPAEASDEELDELRRQLADAPPEVVISNHCYGLFELAAVYLSQVPPLLDSAQLTVDALGLLVDGLGARLGTQAGSLQQALAQIRLAYVQLDAAAQAATSTAQGGPPAHNGPTAHNDTD
jgi:hypothetical protein